MRWLITILLILGVVTSYAQTSCGTDSTGTYKVRQTHTQAINSVYRFMGPIILPDTILPACLSPIGALAYHGGYIFYNTGGVWTTPASGGDAQTLSLSNQDSLAILRGNTIYLPYLRKSDSSLYTTHTQLMDSIYAHIGVSTVYNYYGTKIHGGDSIEVDTALVTSTYKNSLNQLKSNLVQNLASPNSTTYISTSGLNTALLSYLLRSDSNAAGGYMSYYLWTQQIASHITAHDTDNYNNAYLGMIVSGSYNAGTLTLTKNSGGTVVINGFQSGTVTQINTGYGLSGGPITNTGTIVVDTTKLIPFTDTNLYVVTRYYLGNQGYLTGNQTITFTASNDVSGSTSGTTTLSPSLTVTGIKGNTIPSLSSGFLKWNGSAWIFDASTYLTANQTITFTASGDATASASGATSLSPVFTLATVNSNTGSFGDATHVGQFTVNAKGLITAASSVAITESDPSSFHKVDSNTAGNAVTYSYYYAHLPTVTTYTFTSGVSNSGGVVSLDYTNAGTFTNATWHGVAIADGYIASASNWNQAYNKYLVSGSYSSGTLTFTTRDGSTWTVTGFHDGTVTSVATGYGLTGGTITTTGTIVADTTKLIPFTDTNIYTATRYWVTSQGTGSYFPLAGGALTGLAGAGYIEFPPQTLAPSAPSTGFREYSTTGGLIAFKNTSAKQFAIDHTGISASVTMTVPSHSWTADNITTSTTTNITGFFKGDGSNVGTASISLTADVSGTLPVANGGTGVTSLTAHSLLVGNGTSAVNLLAPSTSGNMNLSNGTDWVSVAMSGDATITSGGVITIANLAVTNAKIANSTINLTTKVTGVLPEANGGTNQSTYALGDLLYASASNTLSKLAGNTTTTRKILAQTGNGSVSAAPIWITLQSSDLPTDVAYTDVQQTWTKAQAGAFSIITYASTINPDFSLANPFYCALTGNVILGNPTNVVAGQSGVIYFDQDITGSRLLSSAGWYWDFPTATLPVLTTSKLAEDMLTYMVRFYGTATATMTIASPCVVTWTAHGMVSGQKVQFTTTGALPTGVSASTTYWVTVVDANTFKLSTSFANAQAASFVNTSGSQSGTHTVTGARISANLNADFR
jgi:hypothetical protein